MFYTCLLSIRLSGFSGNLTTIWRSTTFNNLQFSMFIVYLGSLITKTYAKLEQLFPLVLICGSLKKCTPRFFSPIQKINNRISQMSCAREAVQEGALCFRVRLERPPSRRCQSYPLPTSSHTHTHMHPCTFIIPAKNASACILHLNREKSLQLPTGVTQVDSGRFLLLLLLLVQLGL